jgi:tetratricopeptide (TPR) repeat protein
MQIWSAEIKELETLYTSIKGRFLELEKELEQLIETKDANVVMLYSRRCLEVIISDLCINELNRPRKTEPLKGIIDKLSHEEKIPSNIIASMEGLNSLSTFGTHPKDFDPEQVKPVLNNLSIIIKWYLKYKDSQTISKVKTGEERAISEIKTDEKKDESKSTDIQKGIFRKSKVSLILLLSGILIVAAIIAYPKIFKQDKLEKLRSSGERISVAVMPFQNMTNDTTWNVWQDGIQDMLITSLSNTEELKVRQRGSINTLIQIKGLTNYASITPSLASTISQNLDANYFIYGSIKQAGALIRVNAQLIDSKTEEVLKSFQIENPSKEEMIFHIIDSLSIEIKNFLIISKLKKELSQFQMSSHKNEALVSTNSPEAYRFFLLGDNAFKKSDFSEAIKMYLQAIDIDSNYIVAEMRIPFAFANQGLYEQEKEWCLKLYAKKDHMTTLQKIDLNYIYADCFETPYESIKYLSQQKELDDQNPKIYYGLGVENSRVNQYDKAISEFEKSLEIFNKWDSKPMWVNNYTVLGFAYHKTGQYKKEKKLYKKAEQDFPNDPGLIYSQTILSLTEGDTILANQYVEKFISALRDNSIPEVEITEGLAYIYWEAGILDKAEKYYRKALSLEPENPDYMNNLAYFLINNDRNINEGLVLISTALKSDSDNYDYLHTKGWGLYKQGKYQETLDILQKSWDLRRQYSVYDHEAYLHLEEAKKAFASQKNN